MHLPAAPRVQIIHDVARQDRFCQHLFYPALRLARQLPKCHIYTLFACAIDDSADNNIDHLSLHMINVTTSSIKGDLNNSVG